MVLFVERAQAAKPAFALTSENARAIGEICNRLDGLPLAIELAAARVKTLPPSALLGRMETRLQILTGGARDLPARQQTLRGAIAWSHDLLGEAEQRLFRRISVFIGGCTFEAAEAVADTKRDLGVDIIDGIESLVHKSLLQLIESQDDEARAGDDGDGPRVRPRTPGGQRRRGRRPQGARRVLPRARRRSGQRDRGRRSGRSGWIGSIATAATCGRRSTG